MRADNRKSKLLDRKLRLMPGLTLTVVFVTADESASVSSSSVCSVLY